MTYLDDHDEEDLVRLVATDAWEITFMLEDFVRPDGMIVGGLRHHNTGSAFQVLGA